LKGEETTIDPAPLVASSASNGDSIADITGWGNSPSFQQFADRESVLVAVKRLLVFVTSIDIRGIANYGD